MSKPEVTSQRPSVFSSLHRERTHDRFYMTDTDWILYDYNTIGHYHSDTYIAPAFNGREVIFHASLDEKLMSIDISKAGDHSLLNTLNDSSVILQSAMPWAAFCMFIDQKQNLFFLVTLNTKAQILLKFIKNKLEEDRFIYEKDYFENGNHDVFLFHECEMNTTSVCDTWNRFESTLRSYVKRT